MVIAHSVCKLFFSSTGSLVSSDTEENSLVLLDNDFYDCIRDLNYEMELLYQEFFIAQESVEVKCKMKVCGQIVAISPTYSFKDTSIHSHFSLNLSPRPIVMDQKRTNYA